MVELIACQVAAAVVSTDGISALLQVCCTSQENSLLVAAVSALGAITCKLRLAELLHVQLPCVATPSAVQN